MPELPEVHTTTSMLQKKICGKVVSDVWSDYKSPHYVGKENIKDVLYFKKLKKEILNKKITKVSRRGKNIITEIDSNLHVVIHMKMTGHLLDGTYSYNKKENIWKANEPGPLQDPFNQFIHFVISFSDGTHLAFSDMRKFATVSFVKNKMDLQDKFSALGPEPLEKKFNWNTLKKGLSKKPKQKVKTALMDQSLLVGVGNIYSDEVLWASHIHPERTVLTLTDSEYKILTKHVKEILSKGIDFGGDSMSDYRNPDGLPGEFQLHHNAYRRTHKKCNRKNCEGIIKRTVLGGRSAHYCVICQR